MMKIDVFDKIDNVSHIDTFEQLFHRRDTSSSTFEQKMLYSERIFKICTFWLLFTGKHLSRYFLFSSRVSVCLVSG